MTIYSPPVVIECLLHGVVSSQETINRFFYASDTMSEPIADFIDAFDTQVVGYLTTFMNANAGFTLITAQMLAGGSQFGSKSIVENGVGGGDCLPPFVSFDFTLVRGGALERNGYKRIAGVGEGSQVNGIATSSVIAVINSGIAALFDPVVSGTETWTPVIQRRYINHIPQLPPKYGTITSVQFSKIGSQNTRKFGHGR